MFLCGGFFPLFLIVVMCVLQVNRVLKALENPYSDAFELEPLDGAHVNGQTAAYDRKPPAWAQRICIT